MILCLMHDGESVQSSAKNRYTFVGFLVNPLLFGLLWEYMIEGLYMYIVPLSIPPGFLLPYRLTEKSVSPL